MTNPNIVNVSIIRGKTIGANLTTTMTSILSNGSSSNEIYKINSLVVSNVDGAVPCDATVEFFNGTTAYKLTNTITVPADTTLVVISKDTAIYLEENNSIRVQATANGDLELICSYEIIS